jgi:5-methylthioadenosine/S-adenosylhomocysteine deaminase
VTVAGRLVMQDRKILTIDEAETLERVQTVYGRFAERAGLAPLRSDPKRFWGAARSE